MDDKTPAEKAPTGVLDGVVYTAADFLEGTKPYEAVYKHHSSPFDEDRALGRMAEVARALKVPNFKKMYQSYVKSLKQAAGDMAIDNVAQFDLQEIELITGDWHADDSGVWKYGGYGAYEIACTHPIMPIERLRNIDTGELKVKLRFRRGLQQGRRAWNEILTDFDTVSNAKNIVKLAQIGISVTSGKRAQNLVDFITDVMDLNYDAIPERKSVSRMGWNEEGFSPYVKDVVFDGSPGFVKTFEAIRHKGSYEEWLKAARSARDNSTAARIVLAASFASVLIQPVGVLPFFVHLWGLDSGTGKTVAQMVAASVWGNPQPGGPLFPTFKSTSVAFEVIASFFNSLPVCIDELQLAKDARGKLIFNVYELASGSGKLRSNKTLGITSTPTWMNCFITSGESPLVGENDGAGAANRVLEIECFADARVIDDGHAIANQVRDNYGHAGKIFVEKLLEPGNMQLAKTMYNAFYEACLMNGTTEKQALAAAIILTGDFFASDWIFGGDGSLTVDQMAEFLKSREQISAGARGYAYMCDWVAQNANRMRDLQDGGGDVLGLIENGYAYIIRSVFTKACQDAGISAPALLGYLKTRKLIQVRSNGKGMTVGRRINRINTECVAMLLPAMDLPDAPSNASNAPTPSGPVQGSFPLDGNGTNVSGWANYDGSTPFRNDNVTTVEP